MAGLVGVGGMVGVGGIVGAGALVGVGGMVGAQLIAIALNNRAAAIPLILHQFLLTCLLLFDIFDI